MGIEDIIVWSEQEIAGQKFSVPDIPATVQNLITYIQTLITDAITNAVNSVKSAVDTVTSGAADVVKGTIDTVTGAADAAVTTIKDTFSGAGEFVTEQGGKVVNAAVDGFKSVGSTIRGWFK